MYMYICTLTMYNVQSWNWKVVATLQPSSGPSPSAAQY